jgi:hypothetical protein
MPTYEIRKNPLDQDALVRSNDDGTESWIPMDEGNSDYQRYLNPEAEQSTPSVTSGD